MNVLDRQISRFVIVGVITFVINFTLMNICFYMLEIGLKMAVSISYLATAATHYFLNKKFTYKSVDNYRTTASLYVFMQLIGYMISIAISSLIEAINVGQIYLIPVINTSALAAFNYFFMKVVVFKK